MSYVSCDKPNYNLSRGITSSGYNLSGMSWQQARTIATDPNVIPTGTRVLMIFYDKNYKKYNGIYTCRDVGGAIKDNKIDFFLGDGVSKQEMINFGVARAKVYILGGNK